MNDITIKEITNLFILKKEDEAIEDREIKDIKNLFEHEGEDNQYKPIRVDNF